MPPPTKPIPFDVRVPVSDSIPPMDAGWTCFTLGGSLPARNALISGSLETSLVRFCMNRILFHRNHGLVFAAPEQ
jgi:hypothetical protein